MMHRILIVLVVAAFPFASSAGEVRQLTDEKSVSFDWAMLNDTGTEVFVATSSDQFGGGGNPEHLFQIAVIDPVTGSGSRITSFPQSLTHTRHNLSVTEDGQWLAFISHGDLVPGQNGNRSPELFVIARDGTQLAQVTNDASSHPGSVARLAMAGSADRIAFASDSDLTGGNPQRVEQVFVVNRDGTGLTQLTNAATGTIAHMWISDDGVRIAFNHSGNLTGGNADGNMEVYTIAVGDALPRQITSTTTGTSHSANISGDGSRIVWDSNSNPTGGNVDGGWEVFTAPWTTGTVTQLTSSVGTIQNRESRQPWPTDDGLQVFFASDQSPVSIPGFYEVFKINSNGTGKTRLTTLNSNAEHPIVSGNGSRFTTWLEEGLYAASGTGTGLRQLIVRRVIVQGYPDSSTDGTRIVFQNEANPLGTNPDLNTELFVIDADGSDLAQVTVTPASVFCGRPAISGDGTRAYYESGENGLGTNPDGNDEVFGVNTDGTGKIQYTNCVSGPSGEFSGYPEVSDDGSVVVLTSLCNLTGQNPGGTTAPLFRVNPDGSGLAQILSFPSVPGLTTYLYWPRLNASGTWIAASGNANVDGGNPENNFEVWRMRTDGSVVQQITSQTTWNSFFPDISADGSRLVFSSQADLTGQNADHNSEIFLWDEAATPQLRQLTQSLGATNARVRISGNGRYVYFSSGASFLGDGPDFGKAWQFRYHLQTDTIERAGGLASEDTLGEFWPGVSYDGSLVAYTVFADSTGDNGDDYWELQVVDYETPNPPVISPGSAPTTVTFKPEPGLMRYDVIRGYVSDLAFSGPNVDLGTVLCVEDNSGDTTTVGHADPDTPAVGEAFFYLFRGTMGATSGSGSYGTSNSGAERVAGLGDCDP